MGDLRAAADRKPSAIRYAQSIAQESLIREYEDQLRNFPDPMTGDEASFELLQQRNLLPATFDRVRATIVERAAGRRRERRGQFAGQHDFLLALRRIDVRRAGKQSLGVGMQRAAEYLLLAAVFDGLAEVHDQHFIRDVFEIGRASCRERV